MSNSEAPVKEFDSSAPLTQKPVSAPNQSNLCLFHDIYERRYKSGDSWKQVRLWREEKSSIADLLAAKIKFVSETRNKTPGKWKAIWS